MGYFLNCSYGLVPETSIGGFMNILVSHTKLCFLRKSVLEYKELYFWIVALIAVFLLSDIKAAENNLQLSELPKPILQRIGYEFGDISNVKQVEMLPSPKKSYDVGSIGRKLTADEWRASQAWEALAGYNMAKVARFRGMNAMVWCTLRGGGNSVTYMKPLIDFYDHAKLAFYTFRQAIQLVFPCSKGVDVVYGPEDKIQPVIMNLRKPRKVDLFIRIKNLQGNLIEEKSYRSIKLTNDRQPTVLPAFKPNVPSEGYYAVEYEVVENKHSIGRTFEFKYFSKDSRANGETDFHGKTEVFNTDQRVEFLNRYADYATRYFNDPNLDTRIVTDAEVQDAMAKFKPMPLPTIRKHIALNNGWTWLALREGEPMQNKNSLLEWKQMPGVNLQDGHLTIVKDEVTFTKTFNPQTWRFFIQWRARTPAKSPLTFILGDNNTPIITVEFRKNGQLFCHAGGDEHSIGSYQPKKWHTFRVEVDLHPAYKSFSLIVDGKRKVYAAPIVKAADSRVIINTFTVKGSSNAQLDDLWGVGYELASDLRNGTYTIATFVDQNFEIKPAIRGWTKWEYDTRGWSQNGQLPLVIGSERNRGRDLYMRRTVKVGDFQKAFLNIEALDPGGEIYLNGKLVAKLNRRPRRLDVSAFLRRNANNLLAVKVNHVPDGYFKPDGHTSSDLLFGWFAARMSLDLTTASHIENVFVSTKTISKSSATTIVSVEVVNDSENAFNGEIEVRFTPWYPKEVNIASAKARFPIKIKAGSHTRIERSVIVPEPKLWTCDTPNLYKVTISLISSEGKSIDDYVVTTGIRTVRHENGMFLLNGKPEMLNGATVMQFPAPLEEMSTWHRCLPEEWIVKHILLAKAASMNTLRMHTPSCAYSDPRFAEYGDQLGIMFIWVPTGWNRKDWAEGGFSSGPKLSLDEQVAEYITDMKQVLNHPSIVMWEIFNEGVPKERRDMLLAAFYPEIYKTDKTRLISFLKEYKSNKPGLINSVQYDVLGYGNAWTKLREDAKKPRSDEYAVEFAEVAGQANWDLVKCKPWYRIHSYEWGTNLYKVTGIDPRTGKLRTVIIPEDEPPLY